MTSPLIRSAAVALLLGASAAAPACAQSVPRAVDRDITTGSVGRPADAPGGMRYESDGNAKAPRAVESPAAPSWQQGSGQETGGPARELIPTSRP